MCSGKGVGSDTMIKVPGVNVIVQWRTSQYQ